MKARIAKKIIKIDRRRYGRYCFDQKLIALSRFLKRQKFKEISSLRLVVVRQKELIDSICNAVAFDPDSAPGCMAMILGDIRQAFDGGSWGVNNFISEPLVNYTDLPGFYPPVLREDGYVNGFIKFNPSP
jgi:hypothetical protein